MRPEVSDVTQPIEIPDATREPAAYVEALLATLGDRDAISVYAGTPATVRRVCSGLDASGWSVPLAPGEWDVRQIVGHLLDVDIVYGFRWRLILTAEGPAYPGYDEKAWSLLPRPPARQLVHSFASIREVNLALLRGLGPEDWLRVGVHAEQGPEDVRRTVDKVAGHDLAHLNQLERTVAVAAAMSGRASEGAVGR
jgi:DinB superfamily